MKALATTALIALAAAAWYVALMWAPVTAQPTASLPQSTAPWQLLNVYGTSTMVLGTFQTLETCESIRTWRGTSAGPQHEPRLHASMTCVQ